MPFTVLEPSGINSNATFTFANLVVSGNITSGNGNVNLGNAVTANYFIGNGAFLTGIAASTTYSNANVAAYLPTYTGNISANYFIGNGSALSSINGSNISGQVGNSLVSGTVYTNAQPNITSVGTLSDLSVTGNVGAGNILTNNLRYANGVAWEFGTTYSNSNVAAYLPTHTGNISANYFIGNGSALTSITGSNVNGQVANALIAGTVYTNSQPNITSVGTLTTLNVSSNVAAGNILTNNLLYSNGSPWNFGATYSNSNVAAYLPTYTGNINAGNANLGNSVNANFFIGNGSLLTGITATVAQTVSTAAQPNITSLGTLSSLTVSGLLITTGTGIRTANIFDSSGTLTIETRYSNRVGDVGVYGNLVVGTSGTGNVTALNANLGNLVVGNFIQGTLTTGSQPNITSVGTLTSLGVTSNVTSGNANLGNAVRGNFFIGNGSLLTGVAATTAGTVTTAAQPNITSVGTLSSLNVTANIVSGNANLGNAVAANFFIGNGALLTGISTGSSTSISNGNSNLSISSAGGNIVASVFGTANILTISTLGANITGDANISNTLVAGNATVSGALTLGSGSGGNLTGANVISANFFTGTLTTGIQPNVTSVGSLNGLTIAGNANITLSGSLSQLTGANLISSNLITGTLTTGAQPNITSTGTLSSISLASNGNVTLSGSLSQLTGANLISSNLITGTLTTGAQPNITSLGTLSSRLTVGSTSYTTVALGSISGATTVNTAAGTFFTATATGAVTWTFSNPISSPNMSGFILELGNGGIGTQTWPPNTRWPGGIAPTLTANGIDILTFITDDGGLNWRGVGSMIDSK